MVAESPVLPELLSFSEKAEHSHLDSVGRAEKRGSERRMQNQCTGEDSDEVELLEDTEVHRLKITFFSPFFLLTLEFR